MIIECSNCRRKIDLNTKALIDFYLNEGPIKCPNCKNDNYYNGGDKK